MENYKFKKVRIKNHCYYKIFLEKCTYQLAKKNNDKFLYIA